MPATPGIDLNTFDSLVAEIYDSAMVTEKWPVFMQHLADTLNAKSCLLRVQHLQSKKVGVWISHGMDPEFQPRYRDHFVHIDPVITLLSSLPVGHMIQTTEDMPQAEFKASEYYNDYIEPQGIEHLAGGFLTRSNSLVAAFGVHKTGRNGGYSEQETSLLKLLLPHMQRAIEINRHLFQLENKSATASSVLNRLSVAVVLVDRKGKPVFVNNRAAKLSLERNGLSVGAKSIVTESKYDHTEIQQLIFEASRSRTGRGGSLVIRHPLVEKTLSVTVTPANRNNSPDLGSDSKLIAAALFITSADQEYVLPLKILKNLFALTPAETQLAAALSNGYTLDTIADNLGISKNTARNQLKSCFQKTGVKRQAELVRLILSSVPAIEGDDSCFRLSPDDLQNKF